MPTEISRHYPSGDARIKQIGFCYEQPREVFSKLWEGFRIAQFQDVINPLGYGFASADCGLIIASREPPKGSHTLESDVLETLENDLIVAKLERKRSAKAVFEGLRDRLKNYFSDLTTSKNGKARNLRFNKDEINEYARQYSAERRNFMDRLVKNFETIAGVVFNLKEPTEDDLITILAGKYPKGDNPQQKRVEFELSSKDRERLNRASKIDV